MPFHLVTVSLIILFRCKAVSTFDGLTVLCVDGVVSFSETLFNIFALRQFHASTVSRLSLERFPFWRFRFLRIRFRRDQLLPFQSVTVGPFDSFFDGHILPVCPLTVYTFTFSQLDGFIPGQFHFGMVSFRDVSAYLTVSLFAVIFFGFRS